MSSDIKNKKTILYKSHVDLNAKLIPFGGYFMPISYSNGIHSECYAVRNNIGIFDVSHMGEFIISGENAESFLNYVTINNVSKMQIGDAQYTAMCSDDGGIIDDLILYRLKEQEYLMVVNATNIDKNFEWINKHIINKVNLENLSDYYSLIAIQGPNSRKILNKITDIDLKIPFYSFTKGLVNDCSVILSRTGYTGELGFEIYGDGKSIKSIWKELVKLGANPAGLASRDILRLEMKYCLYGNDINISINPIEAGLGWITDFTKDNFIGKDSLLKIKKNGLKRKLVPFIMRERGIARTDYEIFFNSKKIGYVTSGTQSPFLDNGIGLAYIDLPYNKIGQEIYISIRQELKLGMIVSKFMSNTSLLK